MYGLEYGSYSYSTVQYHRNACDGNAVEPLTSIQLSPIQFSLSLFFLFFLLSLLLSFAQVIVTHLAQGDDDGAVKVCAHTK